MAFKFRPDHRAPKPEQYDVVEPKGGTKGKEVTSTKGKPLSPTKSETPKKSFNRPRSYRKAGSCGSPINRKPYSKDRTTQIDDSGTFVYAAPPEAPRPKPKK